MFQNYDKFVTKAYGRGLSGGPPWGIQSGEAGEVSAADDGGEEFVGCGATVDCEGVGGISDELEVGV
jgi:hypothetical protein